MELYYKKKSSIDGGKLILTISAKIIQIIVRDILFDTTEETTGEQAIRIFEPVFPDTIEGERQNTDVIHT